MYVYNFFIIPQMAKIRKKVHYLPQILKSMVLSNHFEQRGLWSEEKIQITFGFSL